MTRTRFFPYARSRLTAGDERGTSLIEYALLLAMMGASVTAAVEGTSTAFEAKINEASAGISHGVSDATTTTASNETTTSTTTTSTKTTAAPTANTTTEFQDKSKKNQDKAKIALKFFDGNSAKIGGMEVVIRFTYDDGTWEETTVTTGSSGGGKGKISVTRHNVGTCCSPTDGWDVIATIMSAEKDGISYIPDASIFTLNHS